MLPPPHLTCELIFADPDCICHVACTETIPKRYGTPIQDHMLRYSEVFRTVMLPPGVACTELKMGCMLLARIKIRGERPAAGQASGGAR